ncbi:MAG: alpha-galactosidase [Oscillospiraceae bacterium]|nr:alpha-galactosidase [Oscillospiraceae bacterium]
MMELTAVTFSYRRNGRTFTVRTDRSVSNKFADLIIKQDGDVITADVQTRQAITIVRLFAEFSHEFGKDERIFLNGYQSWTDSAELPAGHTMRGIDHIPGAIRDRYALSRYGDYDFARYPKGEQHGFTYGYLDDGSGDIEFIGSLSEDSGFTGIATRIDRSKIIAQKDCRGHVVSGAYKGLHLFVGRGGPDDMFDRYFELMKVKPRTDKPISGYTSWYRHYQDISAEKLTADLEALDITYPCDVFQIDDGYQTAVGDWLDIDTDKFPAGLSPVIGKIRERDITPGIWIAPFVCEEKSKLINSHPDWLLRDKKGAPVKSGCNWSCHYALDIYNDGLRAYLRQVFDTFRGWGIGLIKADFLYAACIIPREDRTRGQVMHDAMALLRELCGDMAMLACGVPLASAFGVAEYCRIGCDVSLDWDDKFYMRHMHRERPSTKNSMQNTVFRRQLSGRAFVNDPDVFLLRDDHTSMTWEQRSALARLNALCGGVLFTSDDMSVYKDRQREELTEIMRIRSCDKHVIAADLDRGELTVTYDAGGKVETITI